jgi:outer membrane protein assembly factor BamB
MSFCRRVPFALLVVGVAAIASSLASCSFSKPKGPPVSNQAWVLGGGSPSHALYHVALAADPRRVFSSSAGSGADDEQKLLAQPVIDAGGHAFVLDVNAKVTAIDARSGDRLWSRSVRGDEDSDGTLGGGLAVSQGKLIVTTGFAQVIAMDTATGKILWRQNVTAPIRSAPTVADGKIFVVSTDNQNHCLDFVTGKILWVHRGATELASLLGGASPAYDAGIVVVAYSTGELFALRASNGSELWSDYLSRAGRTSNVEQISDIRASPVIDRGLVLAVSNAGRMVALNLSNGVRQWEQRFAAIQSPWVAGDYIYLVTTDSVLLCITRAEGRIRWARSVPRYENPKKQEDLITWAGPILAGDRLILAGSNGRLLSISP